MRVFLLGVGLMCWLVVASAADFAREQRMASEIEDAILDGDPEYLTIDEHEFLSIYTEAEGEPKGAVVILHGRGYHPDWVDVANPVRVALPLAGWATLSVQMPVLEKSAKYYDYEPIFPEAIPRIEAALAFLREQGHEKVVLLAHSCGAHMAMEWVRQRGDEGIDAYVGVGMGATDYKQPMRQPFPLASMNVPILDVYGAQDYPAVHRLAPERLAMMRQAGHELSRQILVPDANHYFANRGDALVEAVLPWLDAL